MSKRTLEDDGGGDALLALDEQNRIVPKTHDKQEQNT